MFRLSGSPYWSSGNKLKVEVFDIGGAIDGNSIEGDPFKFKKVTSESTDADGKTNLKARLWLEVTAPDVAWCNGVLNTRVRLTSSGYLIEDETMADAMRGENSAEYLDIMSVDVMSDMIGLAGTTMKLPILREKGSIDIATEVFNFNEWVSVGRFKKSQPVRLDIEVQGCGLDFGASFHVNAAVGGEVKAYSFARRGRYSDVLTLRSASDALAGQRPGNVADDCKSENACYFLYVRMNGEFTSNRSPCWDKEPAERGAFLIATVQGGPAKMLPYFDQGAAIIKNKNNVDFDTVEVPHAEMEPFITHARTMIPMTPITASFEGNDQICNNGTSGCNELAKPMYLGRVHSSGVYDIFIELEGCSQTAGILYKLVMRFGNVEDSEREPKIYKYGSAAGEDSKIHDNIRFGFHVEETMNVNSGYNAVDLFLFVSAPETQCGDRDSATHKVTASLLGSSVEFPSDMPVAPAGPREVHDGEIVSFDNIAGMTDNMDAQVLAAMGRITLEPFHFRTWNRPRGVLANQQTGIRKVGTFHNTEQIHLTVGFTSACYGSFGASVQINGEHGMSTEEDKFNENKSPKGYVMGHARPVFQNKAFKLVYKSGSSPAVYDLWVAMVDVGCTQGKDWIRDDTKFDCTIDVSIARHGFPRYAKLKEDTDLTPSYKATGELDTDTVKFMEMELMVLEDTVALADSQLARIVQYGGFANDETNKFDARWGNGKFMSQPAPDMSVDGVHLESEGIRRGYLPYALTVSNGDTRLTINATWYQDNGGVRDAAENGYSSVMDTDSAYIYLGRYSTTQVLSLSVQERGSYNHGMSFTCSAYGVWKSAATFKDLRDKAPKCFAFSNDLWSVDGKWIEVVYAYEDKQLIHYFLRVTTGSPKIPDAEHSRHATVQVDHSGVTWDYSYEEQKALVGNYLKPALERESDLLEKAWDLKNREWDEAALKESIPNGGTITDFRGAIKTMFMERVAVDAGLL